MVARLAKQVKQCLRTCGMVKATARKARALNEVCDTNTPGSLFGNNNGTWNSNSQDMQTFENLDGKSPLNWLSSV